MNTFCFSPSDKFWNLRFFNLFNLNKLKHKKSQFDISKGFEIYEMDRLSSIDIDDDYDFKLADLLLKKIKGTN